MNTFIIQVILSYYLSKLSFYNILIFIPRIYLYALLKMFKLSISYQKDVGLLLRVFIYIMEKIYANKSYKLKFGKTPYFNKCFWSFCYETLTS